MQTFGKGMLYFLALSIAGYALVAYSFFPLGSLTHPDLAANFQIHPIGIYVHIFASVVALAIGPFQFSARFREKYINIHRWLGRLYLGIGVLFGGVAGLYMSWFAFGGAITKFGFGALAILWLFTGLQAFLAISKGAVEEHRKWMVRNFSLTFAAVTLRIYLPFSAGFGIAFEAAYPIIAWLCWIPNLIFAELLFNRSKRKTDNNRRNA